MKNYYDQGCNDIRELLRLIVVEKKLTSDNDIANVMNSSSLSSSSLYFHTR